MVNFTKYTKELFAITKYYFNKSAKEKKIRYRLYRHTVYLLMENRAYEQIQLHPTTLSENPSSSLDADISNFTSGLLDQVGTNTNQGLMKINSCNFPTL